MGRPPAQPVTFFVPEVFIAVSVKDVERVVVELRRSSRALLRPDRLRVADALEGAIRGVEAQRCVVSEMPDGEQAALLRAVEHLRWTKESIGGDLARLHSALAGWVPLPRIAYELSFGYGGKRCSFTSYTGRYEVGDRLPLTEQDGCREVTGIGRAGQLSNTEFLIVEPCEAGDGG